MPQIQIAFEAHANQDINMRKRNLLLNKCILKKMLRTLQIVMACLNVANH